jgi:hypothetical protein
MEEQIELKFQLRWVCWLKPPRDNVKLNIGVGFDEDQLCGAMGVDPSSTLSTMCFRWKPMCSRAIVNSDRSEVVNTILHGAQSDNIIGAIFNDCYNLSTSVSPRQVNSSSARELARLAKGSIKSV